MNGVEVLLIIIIYILLSRLKPFGPSAPAKAQEIYEWERAIREYEKNIERARRALTLFPEQKEHTEWAIGVDTQLLQHARDQLARLTAPKKWFWQ